MSSTWVYALEDYSYPFDLRKFDDAQNYPGWFALSSNSGNRAETMQFEDHFRRHALEAIEPWLEVIYWKVYNQPLARNKTTHAMARRLLSERASPRSLWDACLSFVEQPTRQNFESFRKMLVGSSTIAVAATFPAFLKPDLFPMVDRRVARWVTSNMDKHNAADPDGLQLMRPVTPVLEDKKAVLTMKDYSFYERWIKWCHSTALKLTQRTSQNWRARDVEMAVFTAWGKGKRTERLTIQLDPLPPNYR
jgi:hypothetical protein